MTTGRRVPAVGVALPGPRADFLSDDPKTAAERVTSDPFRGSLDAAGPFSTLTWHRTPAIMLREAGRRWYGFSAFQRGGRIVCFERAEPGSESNHGGCYRTPGTRSGTL